MTPHRLVYVLDDEAVVRASVVSLIQAHGGYECREYRSGYAFIEALDTLQPGCVVLDLQLEGASGGAAMQALSQRADRFRMIVVTGFGDVGVAIEAFRARAVDFLYKPHGMRPLLDALARGFHLLERGVEPPHLVAEAKARIARLSDVEAEIFARLIAGETNQELAHTMDLDPRAVQILRARALAALEAPSILAAMRTAAIASWPEAAAV
ncbi:response regulator transcription factor [Rhizorhabdus argentea]|uniref:response regulator transcription factor n=1 Tax=Rhizorhabdus argentea TaxID=1387174 RepID=UPI0030EE6E0A